VEETFYTVFDGAGTRAQREPFLHNFLLFFLLLYMILLRSHSDRSSNKGQPEQIRANLPVLLTPLFPSAFDSHHLNSVQRDESGNFLISMRGPSYVMLFPSRRISFSLTFSPPEPSIISTAKPVISSGASESYTVTSL
jgi:hypothetical protein